jgi:hypothetical protein
MSFVTCVGCNRRFTPAGYSRHISMTKRAICRAIYDRCVERPVVCDHLGVSGPADGNPSKCLYHSITLVLD